MPQAPDQRRHLQPPPGRCPQRSRRRHSGIDLVDAVAASTSNGFGPFPPYRIGQNRYINGGYRRSENADLAAGYGRVLVLSPFGGRPRMPLEWGMDLATQVDELRAGGSRIETVFPDGGAGEIFDANASHPPTRPRAARSSVHASASCTGTSETGPDPSAGEVRALHRHGQRLQAEDDQPPRGCGPGRACRRRGSSSRRRRA